MRAFAYLTGALSALTARVRGDDPERGDVPGWVMITVMSAGLVALITAIAGPRLGLRSAWELACCSVHAAASPRCCSCS